ncbi:MAG: ATP-binding protein [candidate division Zixibacteria bacterium]
MSNSAKEDLSKFRVENTESPGGDFGSTTDRIQVDNVLAEMEKTLNDIVSDNPRISEEANTHKVRLDDLKAILEISIGINSALILEDVLQVVMEKAVELLAAERGFIMLLDKDGTLQYKTAHNIRREETRDDTFKISFSIANKVVQTGNPIYTSDALEDERYANQKSVVELHLRSIMCVPLKIKNTVIGVVYLDNSSQAKLFLKSDLYLFELFAQQAAIAIHNAQLYGHLSRMKQYNEDIIEQSPVGIIVIDSDYNLITINDVSFKIFQVNKGSIINGAKERGQNNFTDLVPDKEYDKWHKMIEPVISGLGDFVEDRYFHDTGYEEKVLSLKISRTDSLPGQKTGAILIVEDITEKVILEKYVILSEKLVAKGEMAASIGHELNNFLSIISNSAELIQINIDRGQYEKVGKNIHSIVDNIGKIKRFTNGLMDFSKLETEMVMFDIKHLIDDVIFTIKTQRRFAPIELKMSCEEEFPEVNIDVGQIQQVLLNLLNNAADAMEESENPSIELKCILGNDPLTLLISVSDNGEGIPENIIEKIFEPNFTTKDSGHGLGLSNCLKIIKNHDGDIRVDSVEGQGTTFTISLPYGQLDSDD